MGENAYILSAARTPMGKFGGSLAGMTAADLGVAAASAALDRAANGKLRDQIDEAFFGCGRQAGSGPNVARQIAYRALGEERGTNVPAMTVNQACASGLQAIALAAERIAQGRAAAALAGGTESMSRLPYLLEDARWGSKLGHQRVTDAMYKDGFQCPLSDMLMGETAELLAAELGISREEQDRTAVESHHKAAAAWEAGRFPDEVAPVELKEKKSTRRMERDETIRAAVSLEKMAKLPTVFKEGGTVTPGNASQITDGAAAVVVVSEVRLKELGVEPLARIVDWTLVGVDPKRMGLGPVPAIRALLARTGDALEDFDLIELNEAFAAQVLACDRELKFDWDRLNVNGGAIALGHPIGCTGTRIVVTLVHEMKRRDAKKGLATLCVSGGLGMAMSFERP